MSNFRGTNSTEPSCYYHLAQLQLIAMYLRVLYCFSSLHFNAFYVKSIAIAKILLDVIASLTALPFLSQNSTGSRGFFPLLWCGKGGGGEGNWWGVGSKKSIQTVSIPYGGKVKQKKPCCILLSFSVSPLS